MSKRLEDRELAAWRSFLQAHAAVIDRLERELEEERNLPLSWYEVLLHLNAAPERRLRMQDLGRHVLLSKSGITRLVDRMVAAGLVLRVACPSDRRGVFAEITHEGRERLRAAAPVHLRGIREHFIRHLAPEEQDVLRAALAKVVEGQE